MVNPWDTTVGLCLGTYGGPRGGGGGDVEGHLGGHNLFEHLLGLHYRAISEQVQRFSRHLTENGSSQDQYLALTVLSVLNSLYGSRRFHLQTFVIYKLGYNQNYYTITLTLLIKIVLCNELH